MTIYFNPIGRNPKADPRTRRALELTQLNNNIILTEVNDIRTDLVAAESDIDDLEAALLTYQPLDATLTAFAGLTIVDNSVTIGEGTDAFSQIPLDANTFLARASAGDVGAQAITDFGLSLVDDANAAAARTTIGLGNVENTALSTWAGTANVITLGTVTTGTWSGKYARRHVAMADATSFTPTGDTADVNTHANTQAIGNLTANAPSGTPVDGQQLELRIKSTNVQTFIWNAIYRGSVTIALPTTTTGATKTDRFYFEYHSTDAKWDLIIANYGY